MISLLEKISSGFEPRMKSWKTTDIYNELAKGEEPLSVSEMKEVLDFIEELKKVNSYLLAVQNGRKETRYENN